MGKRGPKPKPTAEKIRLGNPGKRPINTAEPEPTGEPEKPDYLDAYAQKVWDRIMVSMAKGVLTSCDQGLLATYCTLESDYRKAIAHVAKEGAIIAGKYGPLKNPWAARQEKLASLIATVGSRLGLDPSARTALKVPDKKPVGKFGEYSILSGGKK